MNKPALRLQLKQARQGLSETERLALSHQICERLEAIDWSDVHTIHCFEPIAALNEVDVLPFMKKLHITYPTTQLYTSKRIDGNWQTVSWQKHITTDKKQFDIVIVPMLGFDAYLHRIGYGGGYYDRFLATQTQAKKIGVCFELGKLQHIPTESHDISLDIIATESRMYAKPIFYGQPETSLNNLSGS